MRVHASCLLADAVPTSCLQHLFLNAEYWPKRLELNHDSVDQILTGQHCRLRVIIFAIIKLHRDRVCLFHNLLYNEGSQNHGPDHAVYFHPTRLAAASRYLDRQYYCRRPR